MESGTDLKVIQNIGNSVTETFFGALVEADITHRKKKVTIIQKIYKSNLVKMNSLYC